MMSRIFSAVSALALLASLDAFAHTKLSTSVPVDGATIAPPVDIVLEFSEPVHVTAVTLTAGETEHATGDIPDGPATEFAIPLDGTLAPGEYSVAWRAVSADTHIVSGEFSFVVVAEASAGKKAASDGAATEAD
jgi:methionine-rich copper-binding protein CopC